MDSRTARRVKLASILPRPFQQIQNQPAVLRIGNFQRVPGRQFQRIGWQNSNPRRLSKSRRAQRDQQENQQGSSVHTLTPSNLARNLRRNPEDFPVIESGVPSPSSRTFTTSSAPRAASLKEDFSFTLAGNA